MKLSPLQKRIILSSLGNGLGLGFASKAANVSAKDVTDYIVENEEFKLRCDAEILEATNAALGLANSKRRHKRYNAWAEKLEDIMRLVTELNLWESFCAKVVVDDDILVQAHAIYKWPLEIAVVCGLEEHEFWDLITSRDWLFELVDGRLEIVK